MIELKDECVHCGCSNERHSVEHVEQFCGWGFKSITQALAEKNSMQVLKTVIDSRHELICIRELVMQDLQQECPFEIRVRLLQVINQLSEAIKQSTE